MSQVRFAVKALLLMAGYMAHVVGDSSGHEVHRSMVRTVVEGDYKGTSLQSTLCLGVCACLIVCEFARKRDDKVSF